MRISIFSAYMHLELLWETWCFLIVKWGGWPEAEEYHNRRKLGKNESKSDPIRTIVGE